MRSDREVSAERAQLELGPAYRVTPDADFVAAAEGLVGAGNVILGSEPRTNRVRSPRGRGGNGDEGPPSPPAAEPEAPASAPAVGPEEEALRLFH